MYPMSSSSPEANTANHYNPASAASPSSSSLTLPPLAASASSRDADPSARSSNHTPPNTSRRRSSFIDPPLGDPDIPNIDMSEQSSHEASAEDVFQILDWHPAYQSCQSYFLSHAQHEPATQALCALINILLPFQWRQNPVRSFTQRASPAPMSGPPPSAYRSYTREGSGSNLPPAGSNMYGPPSTRDSPPTSNFVSLVPYIRRLVVTGFDQPPILHGLFGDLYVEGTKHFLECERRNYIFAAKHGGWNHCKQQYDMGSGGGGDDETVPFMKPLREAKPGEFAAYEKVWEEWNAMERSFASGTGSHGGRERNRHGGSGSASHNSGRRA